MAEVSEISGGDDSEIEAGLQSLKRHVETQGVGERAVALVRKNVISVKIITYATRRQPDCW